MQRLQSFILGISKPDNKIKHTGTYIRYAITCLLLFIKKVRKMGILNELTELILKNYFAYLQCMNQSDI